MSATLFYFEILMLLLWLGLAVFLYVNSRRVKQLKDQPSSTKAPSIAIIIAVRNEEPDLREALTTLCHINYQNLRIIVVNDRSTDRTAAILKEITTEYPQILVEEVIGLPYGWLGKTHAMHRGYLQTSEEWLLFTDADIKFDPEALHKAMHYAIEKDLDHLTVMPDIRSRSSMLNAILATFRIMLEVKLRPWEARNPKSDAFIGVGAFNLIKRTAYTQAGTHERIKLCPDDDLQLGRRIKSAGFKQDVLDGLDQVKLEWYTSVKEFVAGLMKNMYSAFEYKLPFALFGALSTFLFFCLPAPAGLIFGDNSTRLIALMILVIQFLLHFLRPHKISWWYGLATFVAGGIMTYIIIKATFKTIKDKGIYWRDSFYSLEMLRGNRP